MSDDKVIIFDTTLRDGEQSAGIGLTTQEKLEIAKQLDRLGVDVIEAGFAASSPGDFVAVQEICRQVRRPIIASLARCVPADVDRAGVTVGAVTGQSQAAWVGENIRSARIHTIPAVPPNAGLAALLLDGTVDAFALNRTRMAALAADFPAVRVLDDNFLVTSQAIVVAQGARARLDALNPFLAEVRASGFVQASIDRAGIPGVEVAPAP